MSNIEKIVPPIVTNSDIITVIGDNISSDRTIIKDNSGNKLLNSKLSVKNKYIIANRLGDWSSVYANNDYIITDFEVAYNSSTGKNVIVCSLYWAGTTYDVAKHIMCYSKDSGATWSFISKVPYGSVGNFQIMQGHSVSFHNGTFHMLYTYCSTITNIVIKGYKSSDYGETWEEFTVTNNSYFNMNTNYAYNNRTPIVTKLKFNIYNNRYEFLLCHGGIYQSPVNNSAYPMYYSTDLVTWYNSPTITTYCIFSEFLSLSANKYLIGTFYYNKMYGCNISYNGLSSIINKFNVNVLYDYYRIGDIGYQYQCHRASEFVKGENCIMWFSKSGFGYNQVIMKKSFDEGETWKDINVVLTNEVNTNSRTRISSINYVFNYKGSIWIAVGNYDNIFNSITSSGFTGLYISTDDCETWTEYYTFNNHELDYVTQGKSDSVNATLWLSNCPATTGYNTTFGMYRIDNFMEGVNKSLTFNSPSLGSKVNFKIDGINKSVVNNKTLYLDKNRYANFVNTQKNLTNWSILCKFYPHNLGINNANLIDGTDSILISSDGASTLNTWKLSINRRQINLTSKLNGNKTIDITGKYPSLITAPTIAKVEMGSSLEVTYCGIKLKSGRLIVGSGYNTSGDGDIYYSDDNGNNWTMVEIGSNIEIIRCIIQLANGRILIGVGSSTDDGDIYYSDDNGLTWAKVEMGSSLQNIQSLCEVSNGRVLAGSGESLGNGDIYYSDNNGLTWTKVEIGGNIYGVRAIYKLTNGRILLGTYATSGYADIYYSDDNGLTWTISDFNTIETINVIYQLSSGRILIGTGYSSGNADIYYSDNNGLSWTMVEIGASYESVFSITQHSNGYVFIGTGSSSGDGNIFYSSDNGLTWSMLEIDTALDEIYFIIELPNKQLFIGTGNATGDGDCFFIDWANFIMWGEFKRGFIVCITYDGTNSKVHLINDGVYNSNIATTQTLNGALVLDVGTELNFCYSNDIVNYKKLSAEIDFFALYNRALTTTEIQSIISSYCVENYVSSGLVNLMKFDGNLTDSIDNNYVGKCYLF